MSEIADAKKSWLEQVKADAEALTRERLARGRKVQEQVAETIEATSAPKAAAKRAAKKGTDK